MLARGATAGRERGWRSCRGGRRIGGRLRRAARAGRGGRLQLQRRARLQRTSGSRKDAAAHSGHRRRRHAARGRCGAACRGCGGGDGQWPGRDKARRVCHASAATGGGDRAPAAHALGPRCHGARHRGPHGAARDRAPGAGRATRSPWARRRRVAGDGRERRRGDARNRGARRGWPDGRGVQSEADGRACPAGAGGRVARASRCPARRSRQAARARPVGGRDRHCWRHALGGCPAGRAARGRRRRHRHGGRRGAADDGLPVYSPRRHALRHRRRHAAHPGRTGGALAAAGRTLAAAMRHAARGHARARGGRRLVGGAAPGRCPRPRRRRAFGSRAPAHDQPGGGVGAVRAWVVSAVWPAERRRVGRFDQARFRHPGECDGDAQRRVAARSWRRCATLEPRRDGPPS